MRIFATVAIASVALVAGCGTPAGLWGVPTVSGVGTVQATSVESASTGLVLTSATGEVDVPSPMPGHLLAVAETATFVGTDARGAFTIVVKTNNPGGDRFVPRVASATRDGEPIPQSQWNALGREFEDALLGTPGADPIALDASNALMLAR